MALVLAICVGTQAQALTTTTVETLSIGDTGTISNSYGPGPGVIFEDIYRFEVDATSTFSANLFNFNINTDFLDWDLSSLGVYFEYSLDSTDGFDGSWIPDSSQLFNGGGGIGDVSVLVSYANLVPSEYYRLRITGTTFGPNGGGYFGNYKVAAVPLPPAVVLFGLGLVAVFGISRRMKTA